MQSLHNLPAKQGKSKKRVGRGNASSGTYSGRGMKGQRSRSGASGMIRRASRDWVQKLPKMRGFKSIHGKASWIDVKDLARIAKDMEVVTPGLLKKNGAIDSIKDGVKILGSGPISDTVKIKGFYLSGSAKKAILDAGGSIEDEQFRPKSELNPNKKEKKGKKKGKKQ
ncbi:MAG: uL15 family ribosomal protein [Patescibacteria group bacterium]